MDAEEASPYIVFVIQLQALADGRWELLVDDQSQTQTIPLQPATFVVRLRRMNALGLLRGSIELDGSGVTAVFQSNAQLAALLRAWLFDHTNSTASN